MKKMNLLYGLSLLTVGFGLLNQTVYADDEKSTEAIVTVNPGELTIKSVDGIQFEDVQIDGTDKDIVEKEEGKSKVAIEDFRGSNSKGWTLKAKLKTGDFNGLGLKLVPSINSNKNSAVAATATQNLNNQESLVASVADDKISTTEFDTEIQLNAKLNVPAKTKSNTYKTTIVWNLAATPETK